MDGPRLISKTTDDTPQRILGLPKPNVTPTLIEEENHNEIHPCDTCPDETGSEGGER